jgi:hypothetical protein
MTEQDIRKLKETVQTVREKVRRFQDRGMGEQNTKASLIQPILEALGWDVRDPDEVHHEFKPTSQDRPVDYALCLIRKPRLLVEAKGLGESLNDRKWIAQVISYASVAGVEWCVLTDGNEFRFYNSTAAVDAEEKELCRVRLVDGNEDDVAQTLCLISRSNLEGNLLDLIWGSHFVDRRVKECLLRMASSPDKGLIRLIRKRVPKLSSKEILQSLRRLTIHFESPALGLAIGAKTAKAQVPARQRTIQKAVRAPRTRIPVALADLIAAGLLCVPCTLFRKYKGQRLEATLLEDGKVKLGDTIYDSSSTAAEIARGTVTGRRMHTNGWSFWQYEDADGKKHVLDVARKKFMGMKRPSPG